MKAIYPGSFDPIHNGHVEVIKDAAQNYEHVFLFVANDEKKIYQNTIEERKNIIEKVINELGIDNVTVIAQIPGQLTPLVAKEMGIRYIIRGIANRNVDYREEEIAESYLEKNDDLIINYVVTPLLKVTSEEIIKLNQENKSIKGLVPECIEKDVMMKWQ